MNFSMQARREGPKLSLRWSALYSLVALCSRHWSPQNTEIENRGRSMSNRTHALRQRRDRISQAVDGRSIAIAAGGQISRNFPANVFPYRASSHFLYLVGQSMPDGWLLIRDGESVLYLPEESRSDALWHGEGLSTAVIADQIGCAVKRTNNLTAVVPVDALSLPAMDSDTCWRQSHLLGRNFKPGTIEPEDESLAHAMVELRMIHDSLAIEGLKAAADATVAAHEAARRVIEPGMFEYQVWAAMQHELTQRGMGAAYGPIVTTHGEVLHSDQHKARLEDGDLILIDVGAETADGWAGDVTRTWPVNGQRTSTQQAIHDVVVNAMEAAVKICVPGTRYRDVHLAASRGITEGLVDLDILRGDPEELVSDGVHALFFPHGIGHLIGLDVHDMEDLGDRAGYPAERSRSRQFGLNHLRLDRDLEPGMAVTIEPGFYQVPALLEDESRLAIIGDRLNRSELAHYSDVRGIRVEDDILITPTGNEVLTRALPRT